MLLGMLQLGGCWWRTGAGGARAADLTLGRRDNRLPATCPFMEFLFYSRCKSIVGFRY